MSHSRDDYRKKELKLQKGVSLCFKSLIITVTYQWDTIVVFTVTIVKVVRE
jgi:hypothetical protein